MISFARAKGPRTHQEDRFVTYSSTDEQRHLLAILDGHGGHQTAEYARVLIEQHREAFEITHDTEQFLRDMIHSIANETNDMNAGSTLAIAIICEEAQQATCAILGDSPIITINHEGHIVISPTHNTRINVAERKAAIERGGFWDGFYICHPSHQYGLQPARVLGDCNMGDIISHEPEIYTVKLAPKKGILCIGSDGLVDSTDDDARQKAHEIIDLIIQGADAEKVLQHIEQTYEFGDNVTAVVWKQ